MAEAQPKFTPEKNPVCENCGSEEVLRDAYAIWDKEEYDWVLHSTYDKWVCENCDHRSKTVIWRVCDA